MILFYFHTRSRARNDYILESLNPDFLSVPSHRATRSICERDASRVVQTTDASKRVAAGILRVQVGIPSGCNARDES